MKKILVSVLISALLLFSSCAKADFTVSDVDFSSGYDAQIQINGNIYNAYILFDGSELSFDYYGLSEKGDDAKIKINLSEYFVSYEEVSYTGDFAELPDNFLPKIIFTFFKANGTVICFDNYNANLSCFYKETNVGDSFLRIEAYESEKGQLFFSMILT